MVKTSVVRDEKRKTSLDETVIVSMEHVNKWFGEFHVLRDINLRVVRGERIVVCGPSGSCLLYTSPSPRDGLLSRMPSSA